MDVNQTMAVTALQTTLFVSLYLFLVIYAIILINKAKRLLRNGKKETDTKVVKHPATIKYENNLKK